MTDTFFARLGRLSWLAYQTIDHGHSVQVKVAYHHLCVEYTLPAEIMGTSAGQGEFMRLAFAHLRRLQSDYDQWKLVAEKLTS